jgi:hypothetical protein
MAQAVEHLLCKCKALNSNPSPTKKKQLKKIRGGPKWSFYAFLQT